MNSCESLTKLSFNESLTKLSFNESLTKLSFNESLTKLSFKSVTEATKKVSSKEHYTNSKSLYPINSSESKTAHRWLSAIVK